MFYHSPIPSTGPQAPMGQSVQLNQLYQVHRTTAVSTEWAARFLVEAQQVRIDAGLPNVAALSNTPGLAVYVERPHGPLSVLMGEWDTVPGAVPCGLSWWPTVAS